MKKLKGYSQIEISKCKTLLLTFCRNTVHIYDLATLTQVNSFKSLSNIWYVVMSDDGKMIAVLNGCGTVELFSYPKLESIGKSVLKREASFCKPSFSSDNAFLYVFDSEGHIIELKVDDMQYKVISKQQRCSKSFYDAGQNRILTICDNSLNSFCLKTKTSKQLVAPWDEVRFMGALCFSKNYFAYKWDSQIVVRDFNLNSVFTIENISSQSISIDSSQSYIAIGAVYRREPLQDLKKIHSNDNFNSLKDENYYERVIVYDLKCKSIVKEYSYGQLPLFCNIEFCHKNNCFILATKSGIYVDKL